MLLGNFQRAFFWQDIDWQLTWWCQGSVGGQYRVSSQTELQWLQVLDYFLLVPFFFSGSEKNNNPLRFMAGFFTSWFCVCLSLGLIGSIGPVLNLFYLNYG